MVRQRKNGIIIEGQTQRKKPARVKTHKAQTYANKRCMDLYCFIDGHKVSIVMPYHKRHKQKYQREGWQVAEVYEQQTIYRDDWRREVPPI